MAYATQEKLVAWRRANPEKLRGYERRALARLRDRAYEALGGKVCAHCGFSDERALQIDHREGAAPGERRSNRSALYRVLRNPERFQVLCANCNWIKRVERGECPRALPIRTSA